MKKVIIPKDVKIIIEKEKCFLDRSEIKIITTSTNEEALSFHKAEKADLIVAKLDTPKMNGEALSTIIRENQALRNVSIVIICSDTESDAKRCLHCRANTFIVSPIDNAILLQEMHQLIDVAPRKSLRVPLSIRINGTSKGKPFTAYTEDISISGMLFHSNTILFEGDTIICNFYLPDSTHISTQAQIIRVLDKETEYDTNGHGIMFMNISSQFKSAIKQFVEREHKQG
jgi:CheY-like chemotaxis protein